MKDKTNNLNKEIKELRKIALSVEGKDIQYVYNKLCKLIKELEPEVKLKNERQKQ